MFEGEWDQGIDTLDCRCRVRCDIICMAIAWGMVYAGSVCNAAIDVPATASAVVVYGCLSGFHSASRDDVCIEPKFEI